MLLIDRQLHSNNRVLLRLHHRISTLERVSRSSSTKGKRLGHTPTIHTPLPFAIGFSSAQGLTKKLYSISPARAYKNFYNIFFQSSPLSFLWHHSLVVSTMFPPCLIQISV
jgi:hypothetical protein